LKNSHHESKLPRSLRHCPRLVAIDPQRRFAMLNYRMAKKPHVRFFRWRVGARPDYFISGHYTQSTFVLHKRAGFFAIIGSKRSLHEYRIAHTGSGAAAADGACNLRSWCAAALHELWQACGVSQ
jgi:hypothetical protein